MNLDELKHRLYPIKENVFVPIRLMLTIKIFLNILKMFKDPSLKSVKDHSPRIRFKYARKNYLGLSLSYYQRGIALAHHYQFLQDKVSGEFFDNVMRDTFVLWEDRKNSDNFIISLAYPDYELEGDLSLTFRTNSVEIYTLSLTIVPGHILGCSEPDVVLITRSQGTNGSFHLMRAATKALYETTPASLLVVAVMAIAASLNISGIAGLSSSEQVIAGSLAYRDKFFSTYEKLWLSVGGEKINERAYRLPTLLQGRPLSEIKQKYRSRTKRKRDFKQQVFDQVFSNFTRMTSQAKTASIDLGGQAMEGGNVLPI
jgi:uncharacterized protein VirK/YbjX